MSIDHEHCNALEYIIRCRLEGRCCCCNKNNHNGHRFLQLRDFEILLDDGQESLRALMHPQLLQCIVACRQLHFEVSTIRTTLELNFPSTRSDLLDEIFRNRKKRVRGGLPTCWRDCSPSTALHIELIKRGQTADGIPCGTSINDAPFQLDYMNYNPNSYERTLEDKVAATETLLFDVASILPGTPGALRPEIFPSPPKHFRQKVRFAVGHHSDDGNFDYLMWEEGGRPSCIVEILPIASSLICQLLHPLRNLILENRVVLDGLLAVHFLTTLSGNCVIRLLYSKDLGDDWLIGVEKIASTIKLSRDIRGLTSINFIGRSKKTKLVVGVDTIEETFHLADGRHLTYLHVADAFSNPNGHVNIMCLNWLCSVMGTISELIELAGQQSCETSPMTGKNLTDFELLEMYCGMGNHTLALAPYVKWVVGVELSKALCAAARGGAAMNNISNITIVAADSEKFARGIMRRRAYVNRETGRTHDFDAVLVDPPRCGLDVTTCQLVALFDYIVYISCDPRSLRRDLDKISATHRVVRFAIFDQFAYTPHVECGLLLVKK